MLHLGLEVIDKLGLFGKLDVEDADLGMRIHNEGDIGRLPLLDKEVLKLLNFVEELHCGMVIEVTAMDKIV
jgi:hypothetical protein